MKNLTLLLFCLATLLLAAEPGPEFRVAQIAPEGRLWGTSYPRALPSLLAFLKENTTLNPCEEPLLLPDFADERLFSCPFVYCNAGDRDDWTLTDEEAAALRRYLEAGGFLFLDAGINAAFLRENPRLGQHHSFAEWEADPKISAAMHQVFPEIDLKPLTNDDPLYSAFFQGLPETSLLPDTVREYTIREKWPNGVYSAVALRLHGRIAVLVTPIIAMGWARNSLGLWETTISFRVLESASNLGNLLQNAAYNGPRFEVTRQDGAKDIIFCQSADASTPAWCHEPNDQWRVFRYYSSREISDFAHVFYTRFATNIFVYALTGG